MVIIETLCVFNVTFVYDHPQRAMYHKTLTVRQVMKAFKERICREKQQARKMDRLFISELINISHQLSMKILRHISIISLEKASKKIMIAGAEL